MKGCKVKQIQKTLYVSNSGEEFDTPQEAIIDSIENLLCDNIKFWYDVGSLSITDTLIKTPAITDMLNEYFRLESIGEKIQAENKADD